VYAPSQYPGLKSNRRINNATRVLTILGQKRSLSLAEPKRQADDETGGAALGIDRGLAGENLFRNDQALDLTGPLVDLEDLGIPQ
jgi:hypothetical protein